MSEDITIRNVRAEDARRLSEIYAPYVKNTAISFEYDAPDAAEFERRINETVRNFPYIVAEREGKIMGYAYAGRFHPRKAYGRCAELSIYIDRDSRGCGIGRLLYDTLEERLKQLGFTNLYACVAYAEKEDEHLKNDSVAFHTHMGYAIAGHFHRCGYKFGRWYDMLWMEKIIVEH